VRNFRSNLSHSLGIDGFVSKTGSLFYPLLLFMDDIEIIDTIVTVLLRLPILATFSPSRLLCTSSHYIR
jgi:hypothetical protein